MEIDQAAVIDVLRLCIGGAFLIYGSWTDWQARIVRNRVWQFMGIAGIILLEVQIAAGAVPSYFETDALPVYFHLIVLSVVSLYVYLLFEPHRSFDLKRGDMPAPLYWIIMVLGVVAVAVFLYLTAQSDDTDEQWVAARFFAVPLLMALAYGLYKMRLLFGGADAKAMAFIVLMLPFYPAVHDLPLFTPEDDASLVVVFPLAILMNAMVLFLGAPLVFAIHNLRKGEFRVPYGFFGYRMDTKDVPDKFVWLMEKVRVSGPEDADNPDVKDTGSDNVGGSEPASGSANPMEPGSAEPEEKQDEPEERHDGSEEKQDGSETSETGPAPNSGAAPAQMDDSPHIDIELFPKRSEDTEPFLAVLEDHYESIEAELDFFYDCMRSGDSQSVLEKFRSDMAESDAETGEVRTSRSMTGRLKDLWGKFKDLLRRLKCMLVSSKETAEESGDSEQQIALKEQEGVDLLFELFSCTEKETFAEIMKNEDFQLLKRSVQGVMLHRLENAGRARVWVSPKIPFIIPLTASYLATFFLGEIVISFIFGFLFP